MCECTMSRVQTTEGLSSTSELTTHDPWTFQFIVQVWIMLSFLWKPYVMCFYLMAGTHKVFMIESWWITNCQQFLCLQWVPPHAFALYLFKLISGFQPSPTNHGACKWGQRSLAPAGIPATPCFSSFSLRNVTGPRKQETKKNIASKEMLRIPTHLLELRMARKKFPFAKRKRNTNHSTSYVCKASRKWHTSKSQPPFTCDCGVSSSGSRTLSVGGAPQAREVCVVPQEQCGVVTLCDLPGPPEPLHHCLKRNGIKKKKINTSLTLPWQRHRLPQGGANVFWIQDPPFPKKVTGGCPCCLATGQYPQLPKFLESEPTYENKAWDLLSEQDQSL